MKNVIVASFKEEAKAIEALHKLYELDSYGDIILFDHIMVRKNADGKTEILKQDDQEGWRTLTGMGVGSMLGLLGGPVGFVIGMFTGTTIGVIADASHYDFAEDFIAKVKEKIEVGTVTIIAEIEEYSAVYSDVFIDNYLKPLGAVITKSDVDLEFDKHLDEQIDEIEADIAEQREALKKAVGEEKEKIQNKIAELKEKRRAKIAEFEAKTEEAGENIKTKVAGSVAKVKADIKSISNHISQEVKKEKIERVKRRINRHEDTLTALKMELLELQA